MLPPIAKNTDNTARPVETDTQARVRCQFSKSHGNTNLIIDGRNSSALYIDNYKVKILHTKAKKFLLC